MQFADGFVYTKVVLCGFYLHYAVDLKKSTFYTGMFLIEVETKHWPAFGKRGGRALTTSVS